MGIGIMSLKEWYLVPSARMGSRMGPFWGQNGVNSGIPEVAGPGPEGSNPGFRGVRIWIPGSGSRNEPLWVSQNTPFEPLILGWHGWPRGGLRMGSHLGPYLMTI